MELPIGSSTGHRPERIGAGNAGTTAAINGTALDTASVDTGPSAPLGSSDSDTAPIGASASTPGKPAAPVGTERTTNRRSGLDSRLLAVLGRLTERDRQLCRLLDEHRVLTTTQIADVGFTGERRARQRLAELHALEVLDRFRPSTWANPAPYHWTLGPLGATLIAAETGLTPADLSWRRTLAHDLAASQRLAHLVGTNGFFTSLLRSARTRPGCTLDEWWSERRCAREWGTVVRPDGYGIWTEPTATLAFLLEHDNGTEPLPRLTAKLDGYRRLAQAAGHPNWVLFTFPTPRRERDAARVLAAHGVPVATATRTPGFPPNAPIWTPLDAGRDRRVGLATLGHITQTQWR